MRKNFPDDYFGFTRQQRNGIAVLAVISTVLLFVRLAAPRFLPPPGIEVKNLPLIRADGDSSSRKIAIKPAPFDPNAVSADELVSLGLDSRTARSLVSFRSKGFRFRKKEDLKKVYGMRQSWYDSVQSFVMIPGTPHDAEPPFSARDVQKQAAAQVAIVELNAADTTLLQTLPAIGPSFARRIVKYRAMLGGYTDVAQLLEVYGFDAERLNTIRPHITVDASRIEKIHINSDDFRKITRHPYIGYETTKKIFDARRKTPVTEATLRELFGDDKRYSRAVPYISFD